MHKVMNPILRTVPSSEGLTFIDEAIKTYCLLADQKSICTEIDVIQDMTHHINELASLKLYGERFAYYGLDYEEEMDFTMCVDQLYDGYVFDVITVLEKHKLSYYLDFEEAYRNFPVVKVW